MKVQFKQQQFSSPLHILQKEKKGDEYINQIIRGLAA